MTILVKTKMCGSESFGDRAIEVCHTLYGASSSCIFFVNDIGFLVKSSLTHADAIITTNSTVTMLLHPLDVVIIYCVFAAAAVAMLKGQPEGSFVVRNSNSFPGAFALAIKVSRLPTSVQSKGNLH